MHIPNTYLFLISHIYCTRIYLYIHFTCIYLYIYCTCIYWYIYIVLILIRTYIQQCFLDNLLRSVKVLSEVCSMVCDSSMLFRTCSFADDTIAMEDDSWEDEESIILKDRLYDSATHIKVTQNDFNKALATRELSIKVSLNVSELRSIYAQI